MILYPRMSRRCSKTGKKPSVGNMRSKSLRATRRRFLPNLQKKRVYDPVTGEYRKMKVSTAYLRTLAKRLQEGKSV
jgi:large subunit ribosomal protein L28